MDKRRLGRIAAVVITLTIAAGGCSNVSEEAVVSDTSESSAAASETTTVSSETETVTTTTVTSVSETEMSSESSDSETEESETYASDVSDESETDTDTETSETEETTTSRSWSETNSSGTMYVAADCVGREAADNNSTIITKYHKGDVVEIAALTDSGFYKIKGGGYIHSEYLTDSAVTETTVTTETTTAKTTKKTTSKTTAEETSEIFTDDDTGPDDNSSVSSSHKYKDRYSYKQLSAAEQQLYADIVNAAEKLENAVMVPDGVSRTDAVKVYKIVYNEEPQYFWLSSSITVSGSVMTVGFKATKSEIEKMQAEIDANAAPVVAKVNGASSDYEKFKIIYEYVVLNNTFSLSSEGYNPTIYNAFTKSGELQCAGYAKTVQYLCDLCGLESTVVVGTNEEGDSHAWNVVYCGDGYYNLDATWGDPINSYDGRYLRHTYFLVPDSQIHDISHYNVNCFYASDGTKVKCFTPQKCTKTTYNYFVQEGLYFKDFDSADAAIKELIKKAVANKENVIQIRVSNEELFDQLTTGSAPGAYQKYAKSLSSSVKSIGKYTTKSYKATGVVTIEINYN